MACFRGSGRRLTLFVLVVSVQVPGRFAAAQQPPAGELGQTPAAQESSLDPLLNPLSLKEEMIRDRFQRFQDRVFRLSEELADLEPANSARLARTLERAGELGLADELDRLVELLREPGETANALDRQTKWIAGAERLLAVLLERDSDNDERDRQIDQLRAYREQLDRILNQQRALRDAAAQASQAGRMRQQLKQAIERLEAMLAQQEALSAAVRKQDASQGQEPTDAQLSDRQKKLERSAKELAEDLERLGSLKPNRSADSPELEAARQAAASAKKSARSGAGAMSKAGQNLRQGDRPTASEQQDIAEEELRRAKERLEAAQKALEKPRSATGGKPVPGGDKTAPDGGEQRAIAQQTRGLSNQMRSDAAKGKSGSSGKQGQQQAGRQPPGAESLDRAEGQMDDAAEELEQDRPEDATRFQDKAIAELEEAKAELEDVLMQLRQEERAEMLRDLESRFRDLLVRQRSINDGTLDIAEAELGSADLPPSAGASRDFSRAEQLELSRLAAEERALADKTATCVHILDEEGTTIAFPRVVGQIAEDMGSVADRLALYYVGPLTLTIQEEIVTTLEQLLEALQKMQQDNEQQRSQSSSGGGNNKNSPLLPTSAEFKLLRSSQLRVNTRTTIIEETQTDSSEPEDVLLDAFSQVARRQKECAEIAKDMRDKTSN